MKLKHICTSILWSVIVFASPTVAQEKLTLQEAITQALKNNYDIRLVRNEVEIAKNNVNPGNAGMLPRLDGTFGDNSSRQNITRTQSNGNEQTLSSVRNNNLGYGIGLGWTVFDGFQMFTNYERLKELQKQGEVNAKATVLNTVANVITAYYDMARQQQLVAATDTAIDISRMRLTIANNKLEIGRGSKLDVLAATVDYNTDTAAYLQQRNVLSNAMVTLNQIMARDLNLKFTVTERIDIDGSLSYTQLTESAAQLNPDVQSAYINKKIAELNLKQVKGQRYPVIGLNGGYEVNRSQTPTGFNIQSRANGFTYGVTASLNLFNGFLQRQNERNARIEIESSELNLGKVQQDMQAQLTATYQDYQTNLDLLKVETNNVEIARQNLDITLEKYRLGSIAPLELREAQRNAINAITRLLDTKYQAKLTEISLKEISGTLNVQ